MKTNRFTVRQITYISLLSALSYVLMFVGFPVIFLPPFLKVDFSMIPIVIGALGFNFGTGILISFLTNLIHFFTQGSAVGIPIDQLANFTAASVFLIFLTQFRKRGYLKTGLVLGVFAVAIVMTLANYFYITPLYFRILYNNAPLPDNFFLWCVTTYGTFNLIKWGLVSIVYLMLHPTIMRLTALIKR